VFVWQAHEKQGNNIMAAMFCQEIGGKCMVRDYEEKIVSCSVFC